MRPWGGLTIDSNWQGINVTAKATSGRCDAVPRDQRLLLAVYESRSYASVIHDEGSDIPHPRGHSENPVMMKTSPFIPASITEVDVHIIAAEQNGQEIADYDVHATNVMKLEEITERVNSLKSTWKAQALVKSGDVGSHVGEDPREHDEPPRGGI